MKKYPPSKEYDFTYYLGDLEVNCRVDYQAPSQGLRGDYGTIIAPYLDATACLNSVNVNGCDIMKYLDDKVIPLIEEAFLNQEEQ